MIWVAASVISKYRMKIDKSHNRYPRLGKDSSSEGGVRNSNDLSERIQQNSNGVDNKKTDSTFCCLSQLLNEPCYVWSKYANRVDT